MPARCTPAAAAVISSSYLTNRCPAPSRSPCELPHEPHLEPVVVAGAFDDIRSKQIRFLEEAAKLGPLTVLLWTDESIRQRTGKSPKFPLAERQYFLERIRYVSQVKVAEAPADPDTLPSVAGIGAQAWVMHEAEGSAAERAFCTAHGLKYRVLRDEDLLGFPVQAAHAVDAGPSQGGRHRVLRLVSHGPCAFLRGSERLRRLVRRGRQRPRDRPAERGRSPADRRGRAAVRRGSVRFVTQALISSGEGWLDADPEIRVLKPDVYAVNEDGDKGGKREYCAKLGIQYLVLKRLPAPGLPPRRSTDLRGF